ncbi:MAG: hypothetical protein V4647_09035 [Pseudomonadota bacterium]
MRRRSELARRASAQGGAAAGIRTDLLLKDVAALHVIPHEWPHTSSHTVTFLDVALPTFGATIASIRHFGEFERFAAISEMTAAKPCSAASILLYQSDRTRPGL